MHALLPFNFSFFFNKTRRNQTEEEREELVLSSLGFSLQLLESRSLCRGTTHSMERRQAMSEESERIRIRVIGQDDRELVFKVRPDAKLVHLLQNYCEKKQLDFHAMRFYFIDKPIHRKHTAAMLGMRDNNTINAMVEVDGGGGNIPYRRS